MQPPQDNSAIIALTAKLDDLQRKLDETRTKAAEEAAKPKGPTPEELEIKRLSALLEAERAKAAEQERQEKLRREKEQAAAEKERKRQEELEAYRRKHYPELYGLPKTIPTQHRPAPATNTRKAAKMPVLDDDNDDLLPDDDSAIDYFDDEEAAPVPVPKKKKTVQASTPPKAKVIETPTPAEPPYEIPAEVKGKNSNFRIPL